jgi:hypothetical protein
MKANIIDLIKNKNLCVCVKCKEVLVSEFADCPKGCYKLNVRN